MTWTVIWDPSAEARLIPLWMTAPDRAAVTRAANEIDARLRRDPLNEGESRSGPYRVLFVPPLGVSYKVSEPDRLVEVLKVWRIP
jgi:hypothetical protein